MSDGDFGQYMRAQISVIQAFKKKLEIEKGRPISMNEAASLWIEQRAAEFRKRYYSDEVE